MTKDGHVHHPQVMELEKAYGSFDREHYYLKIGPDEFGRWTKKAKRKRWGEVVFLLQRDNEDVLLHTKSSYPVGIYRLLSGGISENEHVTTALRREVQEETGLTEWNENFLGIITYDVSFQRRSIPFASYVFLLTGVTGTPEVQNDSEGITGFRWAPPPEILQLSNLLRKLEDDKPGRRDWGRFRAIVHQFAGKRLVENSVATNGLY